MLFGLLTDELVSWQCRFGSEIVFDSTNDNAEEGKYHRISKYYLLNSLKLSIFYLPSKIINKNRHFTERLEDISISRSSF